jgi:hypothetical protein
MPSLKSVHQLRYAADGALALVCKTKLEDDTATSWRIHEVNCPSCAKSPPPVLSLEQELAEVLQAAREHLEWTGYGDAWERSCARFHKLEQRIEDALSRAAAARLITPPIH